jgi:predicted ATP-grasp superfamily ATP-dependent carboligase
VFPTNRGYYTDTKGKNEKLPLSQVNALAPKEEAPIRKYSEGEKLAITRPISGSGSTILNCGRLDESLILL